MSTLRFVPACEPLSTCLFHPMTDGPLLCLVRQHGLHGLGIATIKRLDQGLGGEGVSLRPALCGGLEQGLRRANTLDDLPTAYHLGERVCSQMNIQV